MAHSEESPAYIVATADPKSSIEASLGAASTPKGEPQIAVKIYFDAADDDACREAMRRVQWSYELMRAWAIERRAGGTL